MNRLLLAAQNTFRSRLRAALTTLGIATAVLALALLRTVSAAWDASMHMAAKERVATRNQMSIVATLPKRHVERVRAVPGVSAATLYTWFGGRAPKAERVGFTALAVEPDSYMRVYPDLGLTLGQQQRFSANRRGVILGESLARRIGVRAGEPLILEGTVFPGQWSFEVVATFRLQAQTLDEDLILLHWEYLNQTLPPAARERIDWVISRVDPAQDADRVGRQIDRALAQSEYPTTSMSEQAMNRALLGAFGSLFGLLDAASLVLLAIITLLIGNAVAMATRERTWEFGLLHSLGFTPEQVALQVVLEGAMLGLSGGLSGLLLSYLLIEKGLAVVVAQSMRSIFPSFHLTGSILAATLLVPAALGALAAALPAVASSRRQVAAVIRALD
ncbi:MAG: FtsX-like permease family protein [Polyangia bacterium]